MVRIPLNITVGIIAVVLLAYGYYLMKTNYGD